MSYTEQQISAEHKTASQAQREASRATLKTFVEHSERISGRGFSGAASDWEHGSVKRHLELAATLMLEPHQFVRAEIINLELTDKKSNCYRTGCDAALKGKIPEGSDVPLLMEYLNKKMSDDIARLRDGSREEQAAFAWHAHNMLFCIHPFREKNSRTARLLLNHVRRLFSLPVRMIAYEDSAWYLAQTNDFKHEIFLPGLSQLLDEARREVLEVV